ncbi:MAG TPA: 3'-5' exonuclease, partial [Polyangiaceae bacterium]
LVNPGRSVDKEAFEVHGIGDDELADKPGFGSIADQVLIALSGSVPVAYNAEFDREFLFAELRRANKSIGHLPPAARKAVEWIDPLVWARELHRIEKSKALGDVCARLGIDLGQAHRAIHDAEATLQVFSAFLTDTRVPKTYAALIQEQRRLARQFDEEKVRWRARPG